MPEKMIVRGDGLVLDAILAAKYDPVTARKILAATLDLNPGLAALGPFLPRGTTFLIPDKPAEKVTGRQVVNLFGGT